MLNLEWWQLVGMVIGGAFVVFQIVVTVVGVIRFRRSERSGKDVD